MEKSLNDYVASYQKAQCQGDVPIAYEYLLKYLMTLKTHFERTFPSGYSFGNVSPDYMDFSYFPFFNAELREKKLLFGIVLNHRQMRFELWMMGQNAQVQKDHWQRLKNTEWNKERAEMPRYSELEAVLAESPDFDDLDALSARIEQVEEEVADQILAHIQ